MTNIVTTATTKAIVAFVAAAMIFTMFATPAKAQTVEDLQTQITALMAQIAALSGQGGTSGSVASGVCPFTWTRDLSQGATGEDVMKLQQFLNSNADTRVAASGAGSVGAETMYYGPMTAAAVSKFQMMHMAEILTPNGLMSGTGYFGPSSRAKANALCTTAPVTTPGTDDGDDTDTPTAPAALQGGEGDIDVEVLTDGTVSMDLGKAETVLEFEVEAIDSDVSINRVDFVFSSSTASVQVRPWLYFQEVNLLVNGEEVATLSRSSDFSQVSSDWRARFSGLNLVIREGETAEVALELVALDSMGGDRVDDVMRVTMPTDGMRFVDGAGISSIGGDETFATIDFVDVFTDGEIIATVSDSSPEKATVVLAENSRTNGVTILNMDVEARSSDMKVTDFWVELEITDGGFTTGNTFRQARLYAGNTLLGTKSVTGANSGPEIVKFDKVDYTIDEDEIAGMRVEVDFNNGSGISPAKFTVGTTTIVAENRNFSTDTETVVVNEEHTLIVDGLVAEVKSITSTPSNEGKTLTLRFTMDVTAYGKDFWVNETGNNAFDAVITGPAGAATTTVATSTVTVSGVTKNAQNNFRIQRGTTREVSVSYVVRSSSAGFVSAVLNELNYASTANAVAWTLSDKLGAPDFELNNVSIEATSGL